MRTRTKPKGPFVGQPLPGEPATMEELLPDFELLESDGVPLESFWHARQIDLLIAILSYHWRDRDDFCIGGNQFIYYSFEQAREISKKRENATSYRGPDFFYVPNVSRHKPRRFWTVWEEDGRYPSMITELLSPTTKRGDRTTKKDIYESIFNTREYFMFDPDGWKLEGYRLSGRYERIAPDKRGRCWSEELGMWLGTWKGRFRRLNSTWLRFFDERGQMILDGEEAETLRADTERQRADAAEAEVARLKARLGESSRKKNGR